MRLDIASLISIGSQIFAVKKLLGRNIYSWHVSLEETNNLCWVPVHHDTPLKPCLHEADPN